MFISLIRHGAGAWRAWLAVGLLAAVAAPSAAFDGFNVNSSTFDFQYNGNQIWSGTGFVNDWSVAGGATEASISLSGSTLVFTSDANNGWIQQDSGASPFESATGNWTLELSAKLNDATAAPENFVIWTDAGGQRFIIRIGADDVGYNTGGADLVSGVNNLDGFHTFRVAYNRSDLTAGPDGTFHVWRDNVPISGVGVARTGSAGTTTRLIVGDCCSNIGNPVDQFEIGYVRYDLDGAFSPIADAGKVGLEIDRATGQIALTNTTPQAVESIIGYTLRSAAGSLSPGAWDRQSTGSQLANDNDTWTVVSAQPTDLSEVVLSTSGAGNGGDLAASNGTLDFGNLWVKSPYSDVVLELLLDDGTILSSANGDFGLEYVGDPIISGDFTGAAGSPDGAVNLLDWLALRGSVGADLSSLTLARAYQVGDMTGDGAVNASDYIAFVAAYDAANGAGAFAAMVTSVPEPTAGLLALGGLGCLALRRRTVRRLVAVPQRLGAVAALAVALGAGTTYASDFVIGSYNANVGNPASPAQIQSPEDQGLLNWNQLQIQVYEPGEVVQEGVVIGGLNAWRNADLGPKNPGYGLQLTDDQFQAMYDFGWRYELIGVLNQGGHFSAWGPDAGNPWNSGLSRVGVNITSDGANWAFTPVAGSGGSAVTVGPLGTSFAQIVITGAPQTTNSVLEAYQYSAAGRGPQITAPQNLVGFAASNAANADRFGIQAGSSPTSGLDMTFHAISLVVPKPDTLTLRVNATTGDVSLVNDSASSVSFNGYFLESAAGALAPAGWSSLEDKNVNGNGVPDDGIGWEEFDSASAGFLGEGFLTGATSVAPGGSLALGKAFNPAVLGAGVDGDLHFTLTDALGRQVRSSMFGTVEYVTGGFAADFNGDGAVNNADLTQATVGWEDRFGADLDGSDLLAWQREYGSGAASAVATAAVPEPTGWLLALTGLAALGARRRRGAAAALCLVAVAATTFAPASAAVFNDRDYRLGDDTFGIGADSQGVNATLFPGATNTGAFQDLNVNGAVTAVDVGPSGLKRPGAAAGKRGAQFNGVDQSLSTGQSLNSPNQTWNNTTIFPDNGDGYDPPGGVDGPDTDTVYDPAFPHNYAGIFGRGIQLWARPDAAGLGQDKAQSLVLDTPEHGIYITANDTWGLQFDKVLIDADVAVNTTNDNGWTHVMQIAGFSDRVGGGTAFGGALYVNGVAVAARSTAYDPSTAGLAIGSNLARDADFYRGVLDDVRVFLWGDNSQFGPAATQTAAGYLGGGQWGTLNLGTDNDWIAQQLASLGVTDLADVDLDGDVDAADEAAFIGYWGTVQTVDGVQIGDWNSRQQGDLNFDGIVNLGDAFLLHEALNSVGLSLNFAALGAPIPEASTAALALAAVVGGFSRGRRRR